MSKLTYDVERINITKVVSMSSLALKSYLTNYYPSALQTCQNNSLPSSKETENNQILNPLYPDYKNLRKAYFGGRVEVFKSYGENLYAYDVNSLFSYAMKNSMPGGNMYKSTDTKLDNYFGICFVTVEVPDDTYNPILPFRDDKGNNYHPTGIWSA